MSQPYHNEVKDDFFVNIIQIVLLLIILTFFIKEIISSGMYFVFSLVVICLGLIINKLVMNK